MALTFFWRAEGTTFSGTDDYSAGDSTPTANGATISSTQAFVGANSIFVNTNGQNYEFDSASIYIDAAGSAAFSFYVPTGQWTAGNTALMFDDASVAANRVRVDLSGITGAGGVTLNVSSSAVGQTNIATGDLALAEGNWYSVVIRWHVVNLDARVEVYNAAGALIGSAENLSLTSGLLTSALIDIMAIGDVGGGGGDMYIDNILVANDYSEALEDNLDITSYTDYGVAASIDTLDSPVLDAEANNAFTTSDFGSAINSLTLETSAGNNEIDVSASIAGSAGSWTYDMPDAAALVVDDHGTPMDSATWPHTITAGDGTDEDSEVIVVNPKAGWAVIEAVGPLKDPGHVYEDFLSTPVNTDQVLYESANNSNNLLSNYFEIQADGTILTNITTGTVSCVFGDSTGNMVQDGGFDAASGYWTEGSNWSIGSGVASHTTGAAGDIEQELVPAIVVGTSYRVVYTISNYVSGSVTAKLLGGTDVAGTAQSANGIHSQALTALTGNTQIAFSASSDFVGDIDTIEVRLDGVNSWVWKPFTITVSAVIAAAAEGVLRSVLRDVLLDPSRNVIK